MKKIIFLSIICCFLSQVTYAQFSSLDEFFKHYAGKNGFVYIHYKKIDTSDYRCLPRDLRKYYDSESKASVKLLGYEKPTKELPSKVVTDNLKKLLRELKFDLIQKMTCNNSDSEIYQKTSEHNDLITVKILVCKKKTYIRWISGYCGSVYLNLMSKQFEQRKEQLEQRKQQLDQRKQQLDQRQEQLNQMKEQLDQMQEQLDQMKAQQERMKE